jgi:hypothetical protein
MTETGILSEGARRVWRCRQVCWWLFLVNVVLSAFGTFPAASSMGRVTDHSLYSDRLVQGFDLSAFSELARNPDVGLWSRHEASLHFAVVFFVFALFLTGGILQTYRTDRKLTTVEFFQACGLYFWRWVRLLTWMTIVLVPVAILGSGVSKWAGTLAYDAPQETLGYWVLTAGMLVVLFLMMSLRLWFDMAQVRVVAEGDSSMRQALARSFGVALRNFGSLFWLYFRISFLAWMSLAVGAWIWVRIPAQHVGLSFLVWEVVLLWWTGTRLWQRASETVWYERRFAAPVAVESFCVPFPEPAPVGPPPV